MLDMDLSFTYVTWGLLLFILLVLLQFFRNAKKKVEGFPLSHGFLEIVYDQVTGKIPKDVPFTSYLFRKMVEICKQHSKDGLAMVYSFRPTLLIFSEEAIKFFLNEKAALDKAPEYDVAQYGFGNGILTSNGERWRTHRKMLNPVFQMGMLKDKVPLFNEYASALVKDMEKLAGKHSVDLLDVLKCNYYNVLSESLFGFKQDEENRAEILKCFSMVDIGAAMLIQMVVYPWLRLKMFRNILPFGRKIEKIVTEFKNFIAKVVYDMKKKASTDITVDSGRFSNHLQKSFTYILLNRHLRDPSFTSQDLSDHVNTILLTGCDTVTYSTLWCLFMLALHPDVQKKAYDEVQSATGNYIAYEETCNLTYLEAIIMETLRLYPTVPVFGRILSEDVQFGKYKVHKGTDIVFMPYMSHRNPDIYPDPEKFEPDRFLDGESRTTPSFIPFSEGSRSCIGKTYALIEMKIFLAYILRNFKITTLDRREDIGLCWSITLAPARHIRMKITPRNIEEQFKYNED